MLHKATFNNISAIFWHSVLLVGETEYLEKTADLSQVTPTNKTECQNIAEILLKVALCSIKP
jgi:hypothetical protein